MSDRLHWANMTNRLRRATCRTGYPRDNRTTVVAEQSVVEVANVMSADTLDGVVVKPADHPALQVSNGVVVFVPGDDLAAGPIDRFHARNLRCSRSHRSEVLT